MDLGGPVQLNRDRYSTLFFYWTTSDKLEFTDWSQVNRTCISFFWQSVNLLSRPLSLYIMRSSNWIQQQSKAADHLIAIIVRDYFMPICLRFHISNHGSLSDNSLSSDLSYLVSCRWYLPLIQVYHQLYRLLFFSSSII